VCCGGLERVDDRLGVRCGGGGASLRLVPLARPTHPLRGGAGWGFKIEKRRWQALPRREAGVSWVLGLAGRVGVRGWGGRWCVLSSVGPRRQSGTCREVKRRRLVAVLIPASRRWTSRQNPDRASPARPRREHTPRGSVWAAPGPGPRGPVDAETHITLMRPPRFRSPFEGSRGRSRPMKDIAPISRPLSQLFQRLRTPAGSGNVLEFLFPQ